MDEPNRVALSAVATSQLEDLLNDLNSEESGVKLLKRDLYRLAVVLSMKDCILPPPLEDKKGFRDRVSEFDPDGILYAAVESTGLVIDDLTVYDIIERLAERGIKEFYRSYRQTGQLPIEEYFDEE
jgi:hypothetical protein